MVHILLTILKIIGILLLVIIGLILLIILCALFVPIRYEAHISYKDENPYAKIRISYLLRMFSLKGEYKNKKILKSFKICGIDIIKLIQKRKKKKNTQKKATTSELKDGDDIFTEVSKQKRHKNKKHKNKKHRKKTVTSAEQSETGNYLPVYETEENSLTKLSKTEDVSDTELINEKKDSLDNTENHADSEHGVEEEQIAAEEESFFEKIFAKIKFKISSIYGKIKGILKKIFSLFGKTKGLFKKLRSVFGKIQKIKEKISRIKEFIDDENNRELFSFLWMEIKKILRYVSPRKIRGYLNYGFEDPSYTGKSLGLIYLILKGNTGKFKISPDFENKHLETEVHMKGRVRLYYFLIIALQVYKNKNFKVFLERRRTHGK